MSSRPACLITSARLRRAQREEHRAHVALTRASTIGKISAQPQLRRDPTRRRPPSAGTQGPPSRRAPHPGMVRTSARVSTARHRTGPRRRAARRRSAASRRWSVPPPRPSAAVSSTICREMSVASTWPPLPTAAAAGRVTMPVPQAMSITCSPGRERPPPARARAPAEVGPASTSGSDRPLDPSPDAAPSGGPSLPRQPTPSLIEIVAAPGSHSSARRAPG